MDPLSLQHSNMSNAEKTTPLPPNAFDAISIDNLLFRSVKGATTELPAIFHRFSPPLDLVDVYPHPSLTPFIRTRSPKCCLPNGAPPRRPSGLPPPGDLKLSFSLGPSLGSGRSGIVYEAQTVSISTVGNSSSTDSSPGYLPPLVVKVAHRNRCQSLVREAWFYDEMECLQGASIARCYGCFELEIRRGWRVRPWQNDGDWVSIGSDYDRIPDYARYPPDIAREAGIAPHPLLTDLVMERDRLFVLVLERLGDELSSRVVYSEAEKEDVRSIYKDVANLGISLATDVRPSNILTAPSCPPGLPGLPSPFTNVRHAFRLVDFELAQKTAWTVGSITGDQQSWVNNMFHCLPYYLPKKFPCTTSTPSTSLPMHMPPATP